MQHIASAGYVATSFRTLPRFNVVLAHTTREVVAAMARSERPAILAGGTDLPARFNEGFAPTDLIDISRVEALRTIDVRNGGLCIGSAVTHAVGCLHPDVVRSIPGFGPAWARIANVRVRLLATLGGNVMARRARYEGAILLTALDARLVFETGDCETAVSVPAFLADPALHARAFLSAISIPLRPGLRLDYDRSLRPIMTQAVATDAAGNVTVVTATEHALPQLDVVPRHGLTDTVLPVRRFADPVTSDGYLNRVRRTLAVRQLQRLEAA